MSRPKKRTHGNKHKRLHEPDTPDPEVPRKAVCGAQRSKNRGICQRMAGAGTDHLGVGRCSQHGGNTPAHVKQAGTQIGAGMMIDGKNIMGSPNFMEPSDALTWCVAIAAGEVAYCTMKIQQLEEEDILVRPRTTTTQTGIVGGADGGVHIDNTTVRRDPKQLNVWIKERQRCVDRLARLSKMALDAGVAERQVALAENMAHMIASVIGAVLDAAGLTPEQLTAVEPVLEAQLLQLEAQSGPTIEATVTDQAGG